MYLNTFMGIFFCWSVDHDGVVKCMPALAASSSQNPVPAVASSYSMGRNMSDIKKLANL